MLKVVCRLRGEEVWTEGRCISETLFRVCKHENGMFSLWVGQPNEDTSVADVFCLDAGSPEFWTDTHKECIELWLKYLKDVLEKISRLIKWLLKNYLHH